MHSDGLHNSLCHNTIRPDSLRATRQELLPDLHHFACLCFLHWETRKLNANNFAVLLTQLGYFRINSKFGPLLGISSLQMVTKV